MEPNFHSSKESTKIYLSNKILIKTFDHDFTPVAFVTTLLAPLNRIKICLQNMNMISILDSDKIYKTRILAESKIFSNIIGIIKDQGFFSLWRGNLSNIYKQFAISYSNLIIYSKLMPNKDFKHHVMSIIFSSFLCSVFYYPFDLVNTKMCGDMTRFGQTKLYPSVISVFSKTIEESKTFTHTRQPLLLTLLLKFIKDFGFTLFLFLSIL
jgi:hypothetical protein